MMSTNETTIPSQQDWVEVADEPNHLETFTNERIRVYVAVIRPGQETLYHRHDKNTLYVVLEGGKNYSTTLPGTKGSKYVFPKSIGLKQKIKWGLTRLLYGWTRLPKSAYFVMHNDGNPVIHKVRASKENPCDMRLMGIEFLESVGEDGFVSIGTESLTVDYEDDTFRVFRVRFPSDLQHMKKAVCFMGIVIALKGAAGIETSSPDDSERTLHDLTEGNLLWNDGGTQFTFAPPKDAESEILVILMKTSKMGTPQREMAKEDPL